MRRLLLIGLLLGSAAPQAAGAQSVPTAITPDTAPGRSLGTNVSQSGNVHVIDGGSVAGTNLFHSFARFDLAAGDVARWGHSGGDPAAITNVVNRVTGGDPSYLFGTIDSSALPNADFFFLNPAGIVFGADAQVNVPAAAHFSTASELRFAGGAAFAVATPGGSTLSVAAPEAFGFIGQEGAMLIDGATGAFLPAQAGLSLSASDIAIRDSTISGGRFQLFAAGNAGATFRLGQADAAAGAITLANTILETEAGTAADGSILVSGGAVRLEGSALSAFSSAAARGGTIALNADGLRLDGASSITTSGVGGTSAGDIGASARTIEIAGGSTIGSRSVEGGAPGSIALAAEEISLTNGQIVSETYGTGDAGVILLAATGSIRLADHSWISTDSIGSGASGAVAIETPALSLADSLISADSLGLGDAGGVLIAARDVELVRSSITSDSYDEGDGGVVQLDVPGTLSLLENSTLSSTARASGDSGGVLVSGGNLVLDASNIVANAFGEGEARIIALDLTGTLHLANGGRIASDTNGQGSAGGILIRAAEIASNGGRIASEAYGDGDGGLVAIEASGRIALDEGAVITSDTHHGGDAGGIAIAAAELLVGKESRITSDARGNGNGGDIAVEVGRLALDRGAISADVHGSGEGGDVRVTARSITMESGSFISSDGALSATGDGGDVAVKAETLDMTTLSAITSDARGEGDGGNVELTIGRLTMTNQASISSLTLGAGKAGSVTLRGASANLTDGWILSDAFASGDAGAVTVELDTLDMTRTRISSEAGESGNSGVVNLKIAGALTLRNAAITTTTIGSGAAGNVSIDAGSIRLTDYSDINSAALEIASGASGSVEIRTGDLAVLDGSRITTSLANPNPAGSITIDAARLLVSGPGAEISSENASLEGGAAGSILVRTAGATISEGGRVTTNSINGAAGNILFDMTPDSYLRLTGVLAPGTLETSSGPGTGGLIVIASPHAIVSHGGNILALGESGGANVLISTRYFIASADRMNRVEVDGDLQFDNAIYDVSAGTVTPDLSVIDASGILRGQCPAVRSGGQLSQLSIRATGPYGTLPSPDGAAGPAAPSGTCR